MDTTSKCSCYKSDFQRRGSVVRCPRQINNSRRAAVACIFTILLHMCTLCSVAAPSPTSETVSDAAPNPVSDTSNNPAGTELDSSQFTLKPLPPEPAGNHELNKTLNIQALRLATFPVLSLLKPIKLEARYEEPVNLTDILEYALRNNLPIKISKESWTYQRAQFWSRMGAFLPNFVLNWNLTNSHVYPNTVANSRVFQTVVSYPVFQGGGVLYGALAQYYRDKGWHQAYFTSINDALLDAYLKYTSLVLNHALLHIRAKSVEVSQAQLDLNNLRYKAGVGTRFEVMQSRTQLASDQQALLQQQLVTRQAALALSYSINMPMSVNLVPMEESISEQDMIDQKKPIQEFIATTIKHRPELREYEYFRVSAARNVQIAAAPLYPTAAFFTAYTHASTTASAAPVAAAGGAGIEGAGVFTGLFSTFQAGFALTWSLPSLGMSNVANVVSARALARQATYQANQELLLIGQQVRQDYVSMHVARDQIDSASYGVASGAEELRLAQLRLKSGVGTNLELIQAQRDYINALVTQAQAIIASNQAQAQLLHDTGTISVETLTRGYSPTGSR